ncbi:MAG: GH3 auxin-responsive promoter family protein [Candidatus Riflebacteria bacterium]|nr:GH3 auxin-responsive promoter family protein [Candidatus Riflebacteria bacterium]
MSYLDGFLNSAWLASCIPDALHFYISSKKPLKYVQERVLRSILSQNSATAIGREYQFSAIKNYDNFKNAFPVSNYDFFQPYINRIAKGDKDILTSDEITSFEPTSGSSASTKLIPLCRSLKESFNSMLHPWVLNLYLHFPQLLTGKSYWVVTPKIEKQHNSESAIPTGFDSDSSYFGNIAGYFIEKLMAVPDSVASAATVDKWRYLTLLHLLKCTDLRLISLWNPAFLPVNLRWMIKWKSELIEDISKDAFLISNKRHFAVKSAIEKFENGNVSECMKLLWPSLKIISCWTEGEAADCLFELKAWFPHVTIQSKGLLATECPITFPLVGKKAPVLAANSAFFEFESGSEGEGEIVPAWKIETGKYYRVIVTTFGGLYRYCMNDIVKVEGFWKNLPMLSFIGKESFVADLRGEKINSNHVGKLIKNISGNNRFAFLAPQTDREPPYYCLFLSGFSSSFGVGTSYNSSADINGNKNSYEIKNNSFSLSSGLLQNSQKFLETGLRENFHYNWCRELGQLAPAEVFPVELSEENMLELFFERYRFEGGCSSTVKKVSLSRLKNWKQYWCQKVQVASNG